MERTIKDLDIGCVVNKNIPNVKIVTGQGVTPNTGISGRRAPSTCRPMDRESAEITSATPTQTVVRLKAKTETVMIHAQNKANKRLDNE